MGVRCGWAGGKEAEIRLKSVPVYFFCVRIRVMLVCAVFDELNVKVELRYVCERLF